MRGVDLADAPATFPDLLAQHGERPALYFGARCWRYDELDAEVTALASRLAGLGVAPGERVALHLASSPCYALLIHALVRLGAVIIPLNTRLTQRELDGQLSRVRPQLLVDEGDCPPLSAPALKRVTLAALEQHPPAPFTPLQRPLAAPLAIIFTSGSSGFAKAVTLSAGNLYASARASAERLGVLPNDNWLCTLPLYHVGGLSILLRSALYGTAVTLQAGFDRQAVARALASGAVTLVSLVPTMLHRLLEQPCRWEGLRLVLVGGARASEALLARALAQGVPVATTYGLTEAASQVATALPEELRARPGTVGRPLLGTELRIVDPSGTPLAAGEVGEIAVRGPTVMSGYAGDPEASARALRDGWLYTGDIGYLDEAGYLYTLAKRTDLIVSGGENIYPSEVEAALLEHPQVADACVVGLPHPEWGELVAALVVARGPLAPAALQAFVRERLAGYKVPRQLGFTEALPLLTNGKVDRAAVRALLASRCAFDQTTPTSSG